MATHAAACRYEDKIVSYIDKCQQEIQFEAQEVADHVEHVRSAVLARGKCSWKGGGRDREGGVERDNSFPQLPPPARPAVVLPR